MTRRLTSAALFLAALAVAAVAALTAAATPDAAAAPAVVTVQTAPLVSSEDRELMSALLGPGADYTAKQAKKFGRAADRVCEGVTASVPVVVMADGLVASLGLTDEEARTFVAVAAAVRGCPAV